LAEAIRRKWVDEDYENECSDKLESMSSDTDQDPDAEPVGKYVKFAQIFYKKSVIDPKEKDPRKLGMVVMIEGKDKPAVDEDLRWQAYDPQSRTWGGLTSFPLKVLTLVYVSDEDVPPSDSEIGRPQVKELNKSRTQMLQQRDRSAPMRWFDVNMVDEAIADQMEHGTYQGMIPMNGPGNNAIGEVARANYPRETFQFSRSSRRTSTAAGRWDRTSSATQWAATRPRRKPTTSRTRPPCGSTTSARRCCGSSWTSRRASARSCSCSRTTRSGSNSKDRTG
jgi:hypothetical protein